MRSPAPRRGKKNSDFGYERDRRRTYLTYENCYERDRRRTYLRGGPQECRRFARARRTAACRHGLLPSTARSSTPASAHAPLWLCTWPSWTRRAVTCHSAAGMSLSKHPQRPAAGSIPAQADARRGLLHGRALLPSQDLEEVRRASCHCILLP